MPLTLPRLFALKLPGVPTAPAAVPVRSVTLTLSSAGGVVGDALTATVHAWSGPAGTGTLLLGRSAALASSAPAVAAVSGHVVGLRMAGSAAITATCEGVTSPPVTVTVTAAAAAPPPALNLSMQLALARGLAGTYTAIGPVPFTVAQNVQPADLANISGWDAQNSEVSIYLEDRGCRHATNGMNEPLFEAYAEVQAAWADPNVHPVITFRNDRPVTKPRLVKKGYDGAKMVNNIASVIIDPADPTKLRLNNSGAYLTATDNRVRRWTPQTCAWDATAIMTDNPVLNQGQSSSGYNYCDITIAVNKNTGVALAMPVFQGGNGDGPGAGVGYPNGPIDWRTDRDPNVLWQGVATLRLKLAPSGAAVPGVFSFGTTPLNSPMVAELPVDGVQHGWVYGADGTLDGNGKQKMTIPAIGPAQWQPNEIPEASLVPADPSYLLGTGLVPYDTITAAASRALGPDYSAYEDKALYSEDSLWYRSGSDTMLNPAYCRPERSIIQFARDGNLRHWFRALAKHKAWRDYMHTTATNPADYTHGDGPQYKWSANEPATDGGMLPIRWLLTGEQEALDHIGDMAYDGERRQYDYGSVENHRTDRNGVVVAMGLDSTWRTLMHVAQGIYWLHHLNQRTLSGWTATNLFTPFLQTHASANTTLARWQRACAWIEAHMRAGSARPAEWRTIRGAANANLRCISMSDYGERGKGGIGLFMTGWLFARGSIVQKMFGTNAVASFDQSMLDTYNYSLDAKKIDDVSPLLIDWTDGREGYAYSEGFALNPELDWPDAVAAAPPDQRVDHYTEPNPPQPADLGGVELNGEHFPAFVRLATVVDVPNAQRWWQLMALFFRPLKSCSNWNYFEKISSEAGTMSPAYLAYAGANPPTATPADALVFASADWYSLRARPTIAGTTLTFPSAPGHYGHKFVDMRDRWVHFHTDLFADAQAPQVVPFLNIGDTYRFFQLNAVAGTITENVNSVSVAASASANRYFRAGYVTATNCFTLQWSPTGAAGSYVNIPGLSLTPVTGNDVAHAASASFGVYKDGTDVAGHPAVLTLVNA